MPKDKYHERYMLLLIKYQQFASKISYAVRRVLYHARYGTTVRVNVKTNN